MSRPPPTFQPLSQSFITKKSGILQDISVTAESYTDKSPKGSIDAPIIGLINELNAIEGIVTTSSCSGRISVFVEGAREPISSGQDAANNDEAGDRESVEVKAMTGSPAGKGGGRWLYVSHDPVSVPASVQLGFFTQLCGLVPNDTHPLHSGSKFNADSPPRFIKLSFSPLILHVLCASLSHAKPLLAAAINAGFRESGVQSLKALDDPEAGVMVGIRTMGLGFETVVGMVSEVDGEERYQCLVSDEYLRMMFGVLDERFEWNLRRRERLRTEIRRAFALEGANGGLGVRREWEDGDARRRRKRGEGLKRQKNQEEERKSKVVAKDQEDTNDGTEKLFATEMDVDGV